jgi:hypothetical protein
VVFDAALPDNGGRCSRVRFLAQRGVPGDRPRGSANPTWTTVRRIADALGVTISQLGRAVEGHVPPNRQ